MHTKKLALFAAASLAAEAAAANDGNHRHLHQQKRNIVTDTVVVTDWVTVTVPYSETSTTSHSSTHKFYSNSHPHSEHPQSSSEVSSTVAAPTSILTSTIDTPTSTSTTETPTSSSTTVPSASTTTSTPVAVPTTLIVQTTSSLSSADVNLHVGTSVATSVTTSAAATQSSASSSSGSSTTAKRGLAWNDASLLSLFSSSPHMSWHYNWGQTSSSNAPSDLEYVPLLWGSSSDFTSTWATNAQNAIDSGSTHLLSFNEPDNAGQANLSPSEAAAAHIQHMNPFKSKAKIGSVAITNSASAGQGVSYLEEWFSACGGNCAVDFIACHWYNNPDAGEFISHLHDVYNAGNKSLPVWVTEFQPIDSSDEETASFLQEVINQVENNATNSFVERIAYFMVAADNLVDSASTGLSSYGNVYATYSG